MRICPKCGHIDPFCWRDAYSKGMEVQYATLAELKESQPEIAQALMDSQPNPKNPIREVVVEPYAYGLWKSGYVRRRWVEIWKHQGWKTIPMEKHTEPTNQVQRKLSESCL